LNGLHYFISQKIQTGCFRTDYTTLYLRRYKQDVFERITLRYISEDTNMLILDGLREVIAYPKIYKQVDLKRITRRYIPGDLERTTWRYIPEERTLV
jgi:hypothetical protein